MKPFIYALTVRQPWAELIVSGQKTVENRSRPTKIRGWVAIHASKTVSADDRRLCEDFGCDLDAFPLGHVVGFANIVDCVSDIANCRAGDEDWFNGPYGYLIGGAIWWDGPAIKGSLGFWKLPMSDNMPKRVLKVSERADRP